MKHIVFALCMGLAVPLVGCSLMKQSNAAHHAIEDHNYNVEKVVVNVKNGHKTVIVHTRAQLPPDAQDRVRAIVMEEIPDAEEVRFKATAKVRKGKAVN